ncbi:hypothetical protein GQ53DRAFT_78122 [Thozetella sp. PMI_491]|nr:hypothetical protein GQ53DRAFT_78122 [Thozetella sp. PMI_491]
MAQPPGAGAGQRASRQCRRSKLFGKAPEDGAGTLLVHQNSIDLVHQCRVKVDQPWGVPALWAGGITVATLPPRGVGKWSCSQRTRVRACKNVVSLAPKLQLCFPCFVPHGGGGEGGFRLHLGPSLPALLPPHSFSLLGSLALSRFLLSLLGPSHSLRPAGWLCYSSVVVCPSAPTCVGTLGRHLPSYLTGTYVGRGLARCHVPYLSAFGAITALRRVAWVVLGAWCLGTPRELRHGVGRREMGGPTKTRVSSC